MHILARISFALLLPALAVLALIGCGGSELIPEFNAQIYVADAGNNRLVRIDDMSAAGWRNFGSLGNGALELNHPTQMVVGGDGLFYIVDQANHRLARMENYTGYRWATLGELGSGTREFQFPSGICVTPTGMIYVADKYNDRIVQMNDFAGNGWVALGIRGNGVREFSNPSAVAVDYQGRIYVADTGNSRIVRMDDIAGTNWESSADDGESDEYIGHVELNSPQGVAVDGAGNIYVADTGNNRIAFLTDIHDLGWVALAASPYNSADTFYQPGNLSVTPGNFIFVADTGHNRIIRLQDMDGAGWLPLGLLGVNVGEFNGPTGIFVY